ncbi:hypothetical protein [Nocardioides cynanchi]|uniref:hypothetical protein n=1 Tax=Nocardioides cynanchi TaxID=2558918 RepID=UPI001248086E|nr:hypothetical protein [Nocardioides cynanchi]
MASTPLRESRRYDVPPIWLVPFLLLGAIYAIVSVSLWLTPLGIVVGLYAVWRLERWADAYVRERNAARD